MEYGVNNASKPPYYASFIRATDSFEPPVIGEGFKTCVDSYVSPAGGGRDEGRLMRLFFKYLYIDLKTKKNYFISPHPTLPSKGGLLVNSIAWPSLYKEAT